jgi:hypothetical protein
MNFGKSLKSKVFRDSLLAYFTPAYGVQKATGFPAGNCFYT